MRAMLLIDYATSSLTFCQIFGLKESFKIIIKHQTALAILRMLIFPSTEICAALCCRSTWEHLSQLSAKFEPWMEHLRVLDMKQQYILIVILLRGITLFKAGIIS